MSDIIERMAAAICEADTGGLSPNELDRCRDLARVAMGAMRLVDIHEGVPGGIAFEDAFFGDQTTVFHAMRDAWNATIDAALSIPKPKETP